MHKYLSKIRSGESLSESEILEALTSIADGDASESQIGAFLMGLSQRGETAAEMTGAARFLRSKAEQVTAPVNTIDCCGTGGDHAETFNISTAVAFVLAGCGLPVAKHGNRAASSKSGAADVLEELGIKLDIGKADCEAALQRFNFCFLMAPRHHQVLKPLAALRKELGFRTIFNLLGPLANPAKTKNQLIGVYDKTLLRPFAEVLQRLGTEKAWIVHGSDGLDEVTLTGPTHCVILERNAIIEKTVTPQDFGLSSIATHQIKGGTAKENAKALSELLSGVPSAYRDVVLANAAVGLYLSGHAKNLKDGVAMAADTIDDGRAKEVFTRYRDFTRSL